MHGKEEEIDIGGALEFEDLSLLITKEVKAFKEVFGEIVCDDCGHREGEYIEVLEEGISFMCHRCIERKHSLGRQHPLDEWYEGLKELPFLKKIAYLAFAVLIILLVLSQAGIEFF